MKRYNHADMFVVELESLERDEEDREGHLIVLRVINQTISPAIFNQAVNSVFADADFTVEVDRATVKFEMDAEKLTDGESDFSDTEEYLEEVASRILSALNKLSGNATVYDMSSPYRLLD